MKIGFFFFLSFLTLALSAGSAAGTFVPLTGAPGSQEDVVDVQVLTEGPEGITIEYQLDGFDLEEVVIGGQTHYTVSLGKESRSLEAGSPELPNIARSVIIPDDAAMEVRILESSFQEFTGVPVAPSKGNLPRTIDPATVPYAFGPVYAGNAAYPAALTSARDPYIMRDVRGMVVVVNPFIYYPAEQTLRVYDRLVVTVEPVGPGQINVLDRGGRTPKADGEFIGLYDTHFINAGPLRYMPISEVGEMLVIAYDDFGS